jgi:predicted dehydrogenase
VEEVLAVEGLDAAIVSSTPHLHYQQARAALERNLHVLIEKPMTLTVAEAEELVSLAERQNMQFLISCPWHYTAHGVAARELIQTGALGRLKMISILMTNFSGGLYRGLSWDEIFRGSAAFENAVPPYQQPGQTSYSDPAVAGGGQIYCQVSHVAAYLGFLTDAQPAEVFARFDNGDTDVDLFDTLNIKLDDGTLVALASTGDTMLTERNFEVRVYGTEGMLLLELWKGTMVFHARGGKVTRYPDLSEEQIYPLFAPANNLVDAVRGQARMGSPAHLGLFSMRVIDAASRSARGNRNIVLDRS